MKPKQFSLVLLIAGIFIAKSGTDAQVVPAAGLTKQQATFFENRIRPALIQYCYDCHSEETGKTRGGLLLDTREGMLQGGDNGNILAGSNYRETLFWEAINWRDLEMPPKEQMPVAVIQDFERWLQMGAPDPRERQTIVVDSSIDIEAGRQHWAFQALQRSSGNTIDTFVNNKLSQASLQPAPPAEPRTLIRRLYYDLIGLPPNPADTERFLKNWQQGPQQALDLELDQLLKRPQYGERWGRHWLDVARYAESTGKDVNLTYPHIWRYRDYVIDSFNQDKPYDQFVREQIAGDLLKVASDAEWQKNLIATGFLAMGTKSLNESNPRQHRMDVADEQIDAVSQSILGLTVSCARCHDHKYDPIPTSDYYALAGIFLSTDTFFGTVRSAQNKRPSRLLQLPIEDPALAVNRYSSDEMEAMQEQRIRLIQARRNARLNNNASQMQMAAIRRRISDLEAKLAQIDREGIPLTMTMGVQDGQQPGDTRVLLRGDVEKPAQAVTRGFLQVLPGGGPAKIPAGKSGRLELAYWLTSKDNPLTARVMVNRIWLKLFGEGLVTSPNNWGTTGNPPSHPELLDSLAAEFMDHGWSVKHLIRTIVRSATYQRSSLMITANYDQDPDNALLWRMNPRPLDGESLRDSILTLGGGLDLERPYGSLVSEAGDNRVGRGFNQERLRQDVRYRSVYLPILRDDLPEALGLFDFADPNQSKPKRDTTNVPAQALFLMNNPVLIAEAIAMAKRLSENFPKREDQIRQAFLLAYNREPEIEDLKAAENFFATFQPAAPSSSGASATRRGPRASGRAGLRRQGQGRPRPGMIGENRRGMVRGLPGMNGRGQGRGSAPSPTPLPNVGLELQPLAMFCQALMASGEFRILN